MVRQRQRSSTSSEQKPGPIAIIRPGLPAGGRLAMVSRSTCSTDADDRLPTSASERQVSSSASSGRAECRGDRLDDLRAAGVTHPGVDVVDVEAVGSQEAGDVVAEVAFDDPGTSGDSTRRNPLASTSQPIVCRESG